MNHDGLGFTQFFWLILVAFIVALIARRFRVPYALALVVTGLALGLPRLMPHVHLDPELLFTVFLPPLLFESAINLHIEALHSDWKPIALYTLAGTIASTFIVGGLTAWGLHVPLAAGLVFGALISTTDPISVIAIFKRLGADRRLMLIIEAESLFNNDTAVVLFTVMMGLLAGGNASLLAGIWQFLRLVVGGALLGIGIAAGASRIHYELDDHLIEITLTTVVAFGSYLCAEAMHVSGVMAVVTAGIVIGNYGMPNVMSPGTRLAVSAFWEYAAFVVNSLVFLLIGIEVAHVNWTHRLGIALAAVVIVLAGRAAIYPLSALVNRLNGRIPFSWQHVLFWGGLRGALSMALVLGLPQNFPQRDTLVAATFAVVLFSLLVQGSTAGLLLKRLGLAGGPAHQADATSEERRLMGEVMACEAALAELEHLHSVEAYPNWSIAMLEKSYRDRLTALEATLQVLNPEHRALRDRQATAARRLALTAEKSGLQEATRQGWLDEPYRKQLTARIDAELAALHRKPVE
jgi:CPA1 family monovalent cation:H+ antiporter